MDHSRYFIVCSSCNYNFYFIILLYCFECCCRVDQLDLVDIRILTHSLFQVLTSPLSNNNNNNNNNNKNRAISGKHIIVSMGSRGVLWCTSSQHSNNINNNNNNNRVTDDINNISSWHFPAVPVNNNNSNIVTNGAGDAFFAGVLHAICDKNNNNSSNNNNNNNNLPDEDCIRRGLLSAHEKLVNSC